MDKGTTNCVKSVSDKLKTDFLPDSGKYAVAYLDVEKPCTIWYISSARPHVHYLTGLV